MSCVKYTLCTFLLYAYWPVVQNSLPCAFLICVKRHKLSFKIHMRLCFQNLRGAASPPTRRRPASSSWAPATCLWTRRMCGHAVDLPRRIWIPPPPLPLITTARPPGSGLLVLRRQDPPARAPHHRRLPAFRRQSVYHRCVWFYSVEFNWSILFILYFLYIMEI